jgi:hypothetical protein
MKLGLEKHHYIAAIEKRAAQIYGDDMSPARAFAHALEDDDVTKLLYAASKRAPGSEIKPEPSVAPSDPDAAAKALGPAHYKMHVLATDHMRANPRLSYEAAYARMYTHRDTAALRDQVVREHLAKSMAAIHR